MELCSSGHEEIAYESNVRCPACEVADDKDKEIDSLQSDNNDLTSKNDELSEDVKALQQELIDLRAESKEVNS